MKKQWLIGIGLVAVVLVLSDIIALCLNPSVSFAGF